MVLSAEKQADSYGLLNKPYVFFAVLRFMNI